MPFEFTEKSEDCVGIKGEGKSMLIQIDHVIGMGVQVRGPDFQVILNTTQGSFDIDPPYSTEAEAEAEAQKEKHFDEIFRF
ncbi:hypothetical protein GO290_02757 [Ralstonia solanacearum]|nr:hypothetical protein [Ralstonia solanacearum]